MPELSITPDEAQKITIESYNQHVDEYLDKRSEQEDRTMAFWPGVEYFLKHLEPGEKIFEIGSGSGTDAKMIEELGFKVRRSDAAKSFLQLLTEQGYESEYYNVLDGPHAEKCSAIFANAVLLHFNEEQFGVALDNIYQSLLPDGLLCIGMKLGDFEGWREKGLAGKRYFKFWKLDELDKKLARAHLKVLNSVITPLKDFVIITATK